MSSVNAERNLLNDKFDLKGFCCNGHIRDLYENRTEKKKKTECRLGEEEKNL